MVINEKNFVWIGFGLVMGGGGIWCGAWDEEKVEDDSNDASPAEPLPGKPPKPDVETLEESNWEASNLKIPAIGLCVAGAIDSLALLVIVGLAVYVSTQPADRFGIPGLMELLMISSGTIFGIGRLVGGISMISRRSYAISIAGAICGLVPCGVAGILGLPFGIWSLIVLNTPEARREFEVAAELREQQAFEREEY